MAPFADVVFERLVDFGLAGGMRPSPLRRPPIDTFRLAAMVDQARPARVLVVEDVVTTGGSTVRAIERVREEGLEIAGVVSVLDRLAGGGDAIEAAAGAPYVPLTTIDDVYPKRPDR